MNFHQLTNFQLYSVIHSRHLDAAQKQAAQQELDRRNLAAKELEELAKELAAREHPSKWVLPINSKIMWLVLAVLFLLVFRQSSCGS